MALPKIYNPIIFTNDSPPELNEDNLNEMSEALNDLDDRVIMIAGEVVEKAAQIIELGENPPYIGTNGNWYIWDTDTGAYVDSGIDASISVEIADVTMLPVGSDPYVTNTGTDTDPVFHLFIPMGNDGSYNNLSDKPKINGTTLSGSGQGNTYALTDISMVAKYMPNTDLVPTGQTYEKGAIVWIKGLYGQNLRRMDEDAAAGSNWVNKSSAVTLNDLINMLYTNIDSEVLTRSSLTAHNLLELVQAPFWSGASGYAFTDAGINLTSFVPPYNAEVYVNKGLSTDGILFKAGSYIISNKQTTNQELPLYVRRATNNVGDNVSITVQPNQETTLTLTADTCLRLNYWMESAKTYTGVLSPMIRLATDTDTTYRPYAKSNKQLTDNVTDIETAIAPIEIGTASQAYAKNEYLILNDKLYKTITAIVSGATLIVGTNIEQTSVAEELELNNIQLELTGISTNKGIIEGVFTNVIPLLTRDLMKCSGVVKVPGANTFGFTVLRISSTMYYGFFHANDRVFTAISSSGTVTAYQIVGTAI